ncbi:MAG: helix-turn-helix transcriptional regulator [Oceanospirillaceae bacterium]
MTKNSADKTKAVVIQDHWISFQGQPLQPTQDIPRRVFVRNSDIYSGGVIPSHSHARGQLLFLTEGLVEAKIRDGETDTTDIWIVPPHRAVWIPPYLEHEIRVIHSVKMNNVYIAPQAAEHLPTNCQVVNVSNLLRELIIAIASFDALYDETGAEGRLVGVFLDQLNLSEEAPLHLPMPQTPALKKITRTLIKHPERHFSMLYWQQHLGISSRTLARKFLEETSMTYSQWRQQAKLLNALQRISQGEAVANIALDLGYQSQSAFISMFKKALGKTPGKYFSDVS